MITVRRAARRYEVVQPGIISRHCFAAGPHYDAGNVAFGSLVAVDEHLVEPGAGFGWHAHRGVEIETWVADGSLLHRGTDGRELVVAAGERLHQSAADGLRHEEANACADRRLRIVQTTWLSHASAELSVVHADARLDGALVHLYLGSGEFALGPQTLTAGDSVRADEPLQVRGSGDLLVWTLAD